MSIIDAHGDLHGPDGTYQKRTRRDSDVVDLNAEPIDPYSYDGDDVDGVAERDGWTPRDWEEYYDGRRARGEGGDTCSECGGDADPDLDELCRDCNDRFN
jgi:hypothetical protein